MLPKLIDDMKSAMKEGRKPELNALRNLIGKLKAKQIDQGKELTNDESIRIIKSSAKQLRDSISQYKNGGRIDLVEKESFELSIVEKYLPEEMNESEIFKIVNETIKSLNAKSMNDMGKVMGVVMQKIGAEADGKIVQSMVRKELT